MMRRLVLVLVLLGDTGLARAQVTVDLHALDALPPSAAAPRPAPRSPARRPVPSASKPSAAPAPRSEATAQPTATPLPSAAAGPPPPAVALSSEAPAPAAAQPAAAPLPQPPPQPSRTLRVDFAPGQSDLTPPEAGAVAGLGQEVPKDGAVRVEVLAYAPATQGDASAARRLSLARALAVRSALAGAGVPTGSITLRALGSPPTEQAGAADTAVVTVTHTGDTAAPKQGKQP